MNSFKRLKRSFSHAVDGFKITYLLEHNMKIHLSVSLLVIIIGLFFKLNNIEWIVLVFTMGLVISAEILNTSIEYLVDLATEELNWNAKNAKDTAAAYVMVLSITAVVIGSIIFMPKIIELIKGVLW